MKIGYARVSTDRQVTDLQINALNSAGCEVIHQDKMSGLKTSRDGLNECLSSLAAGDTLVVWKLDRLGRSLSHLMKVMEDFKTRGIHFESLTEKIDTATPSGELLFHVIGALAQFERAIIRERVVAGLKATKDKGTVLGRRRVILEDDIDRIIEMDLNGSSQTEIAKFMGISQPSVSRILKDKSHER